MPTINLFQSQQADIDRRRALAQALQAESMSPLELPQMPGVNVSPAQGWAKIAQGLVAALQGRKLKKEQSDLDTRSQSERDSIMKGLSQALQQPQGQNVNLGMAPLQQMPLPGDTAMPSPMTPAGSRTLILPPATSDVNAHRAGLAESYGRALQSGDPALQQFGSIVMNDHLGQQKDGREKAARLAEMMQQQGFTAGENALNRQAQNQPQVGSGALGTYWQSGPNAGEIITQAPPSQPPSQSSAIQEYTYYADQEKAAGRTPISFNDYQAMDANRKNPPPVKMLGDLTPEQFSAMTQMSNSLKSHPMYMDMLDIDGARRGVDVGLSQKNGFGDITAINAFQRMVDPGVSVREGDVALLQGSASWLSRVLSDFPIERLKTGARLPDEVREQMRTVAKQLYDIRASHYNDSVGSQFKSQAGVTGIPFHYIGRDFAVSGGQSGTPANTTERTRITF